MEDKTTENVDVSETQEKNAGEEHTDEQPKESDVESQAESQAEPQPDSPEDKKKKITPEYVKIMIDFCKDISTTFPEYESTTELLIYKLVHSDYSNLDINSEENFNEDIESVYNYCCDIYPERFFDILYKNNEMFSDPKVNTNFLPGVDFNYIWKQDISEATREVIWKYLQLILFTLVENIDGIDNFKSTAKIFEAMDEESLKGKLSETIKQMEDFFTTNDGNSSKNSDKSKKGESGKDADMDMFDEISKMMKDDLSGIDLSGIEQSDLPNIQNIQDNLTSLLDGKLGRLAQEIAEETASEIELDFENVENPKEVFEKMLKNPNKLIDIIKNVGSKIEEKVKSGEVKESELMKEATEMMGKMKDMPGMKNMESMLGNMGLPFGKGAKVNMGAFQSMMKTNIKKSKQKERMMKKLNENRKEKELEEQVRKILRMSNIKKANRKKFVHKTFRSGDQSSDKPQKSKRQNKKKQRRRKNKRK